MKGIAWNPWHGCSKISEGCANCWLYRMDGKYGRDTAAVTRSKSAFDLPLKKDRSGAYKVVSDTQVATCFSSDFFIEAADSWRDVAWEIIRARSDLEFLIPTKRICRINDCLPRDWGEGYDNVLIAVSVENQKCADERIPYLLNAPLKKRGIFAAPLIGRIDLSPYFESGRIDLVSAAGESCFGARECRFEWVEALREECLAHGAVFRYHQTGSNLVKDGVRYRIPRKKEYEQAKKAFREKT